MCEIGVEEREDASETRWPICVFNPTPILPSLSMGKTVRTELSMGKTVRTELSSPFGANP